MGMMLTQLARSRLRNYPENLFRGGAVGTWFDPSDFSTMFQDAAGTTPVTALGQPVGKILDKSPRGNHATCPGATTSRPTLQARVNLLQKTDQPSDSYWLASAGVAKSGGVESFDGGLTATRMTCVITLGTVVHRNNLYITGLVANTNMTARARVKYVSGAEWYRLMWYDGSGNQARAWFNIKTGVIGNTTGGGAGVTTSASIVPAGNGYYDLIVSGYHNSVSGYWQLFPQAGDNNTITADAIYDLAATQLAFSDDPYSTTYQHVNTATDYTDIGSSRYLAFDGIDDWLETAAIDMTSTDSMVAVAGLRKNSDAAKGILFELSAASISNNGSFGMLAPASDGEPDLFFRSRGALASDLYYQNSVVAAPMSSVVSGIADISTDTNIIRRNGALAATLAADQGTGNYGNHNLYIGRRGGTVSPFNGRLYGLVIVGATQANAIVSTLEKYMAMKTGVTF